MFIFQAEFQCFKGLAVGGFMFLKLMFQGRLNPLKVVFQFGPDNLKLGSDLLKVVFQGEFQCLKVWLGARCSLRRVCPQAMISTWVSGMPAPVRRLTKAWVSKAIWGSMLARIAVRAGAASWGGAALVSPRLPAWPADRPRAGITRIGADCVVVVDWARAGIKGLLRLHACPLVHSRHSRHSGEGRNPRLQGCTPAWMQAGLRRNDGGEEFRT